MKTLLTVFLGLGLVCSSFAGQTNGVAAANATCLTRALVVTKTFVSRLHKALPPKADESNQALLVRYLKTKHVEIKPPATLVLDEKHKKLTVHATIEQLDKIERLVSKFQDPD